jgi:replication-associated recombination protein RarA
MRSILLATFARSNICSDKYLLSRAGYYREAHRHSCISSELLYGAEGIGKDMLSHTVE